MFVVYIVNEVAVDAGCRDLGLSNLELAASGALLTFAKTSFCTSRSIAFNYNFLVMAKSRNNLLRYNGSATVGALLTFGKTGCGTCGSYSFKSGGGMQFAFVTNCGNYFGFGCVTVCTAANLFTVFGLGRSNGFFPFAPCVSELTSKFGATYGTNLSCGTSCFCAGGMNAGCRNNFLLYLDFTALRALCAVLKTVSNTGSCGAGDYNVCIVNESGNSCFVGSFAVVALNLTNTCYATSGSSNNFDDFSAPSVLAGSGQNLGCYFIVTSRALFALGATSGAASRSYCSNGFLHIVAESFDLLSRGCVAICTLSGLFTLGGASCFGCYFVLTKAVAGSLNNGGLFDNNLTNGARLAGSLTSFGAGCLNCRNLNYGVTGSFDFFGFSFATFARKGVFTLVCTCGSLCLNGLAPYVLVRSFCSCFFRSCRRGSRLITRSNNQRHNQCQNEHEKTQNVTVFHTKTSLKNLERGSMATLYHKEGIFV